MTLLAELKRRNVIRMAGLYLVGAWLITQVAGTILPMFGAPDWIARTVVILLAIGFVPALVFSWVFELTRPSDSRSTPWLSVIIQAQALRILLTSSPSVSSIRSPGTLTRERPGPPRAW